MDYGLVHTVFCIVFSSEWVTYIQLCHSASNSEHVTQFLMHDSGTSVGKHQRLLPFFGDNTVDINTVHCWVIKSRGSGGNLNLHDQLVPASLVTATQNLNRQEVDGNLLKQIN
jgi:hypothetical protein